MDQWIQKVSLVAVLLLVVLAIYCSTLGEYFLKQRNSSQVMIIHHVG